MFGRPHTTKNLFPKALIICWPALGWGCSEKKDDLSIAPAFIRPTVVAVAPILNFSGEFHLDPIKAADLLASELTYVKGVAVLPVNRVVAVLTAEGKSQVESPAHALALADAVGADVILIAGITEYDAYTPTVGLVVQMYVPNAANENFDAITASRQSEPFTATRMADPLQPTSQFQAVFNGGHDQVRRAVQKYATPRIDEEENHLGWRQYLKVQSQFLRFCWHSALSNLMKQERSRRILLASENLTEDAV